jgi:hypothetical protein
MICLDLSQADQAVSTQPQRTVRRTFLGARPILLPMTILRRIAIAATLFIGLLAPLAVFGAVPPPVPALPDTERRTNYSISSSTCSCSVGFALFGDSTDYQSWVEVFINGVQVAYNDATYGWTITSVTGPLATIPRPITDGVLTFTNPQTGTVQIVGARRPRRTSQFQENRGVAARDLNQVITDEVSMLREVWDKINDVTGRGLFSQPGVTLSTMPLPSACAGKFIGFDVTGLIPQCSAGGAGSGNVVGPATSTANHLAIWNNTTGTLLADTPTGTGILTALGINVGTAGSVVVNGGALGTPSSGTLTNATGLPIAGVTGWGTGVATALAVNVGTAGSPVVNGGALGTPSGGTLTNATGLPAAGVVGTAATLTVAGQTVTGGVHVTSNSLGTISSGTTTLDNGTRPTEYLTNGGAFTLAADTTHDGSVAVEATNNGSAGTITVSGISGSCVGATPDTTNTHKFLYVFTTVNGHAYCSIVAGQ